MSEILRRARKIIQADRLDDIRTDADEAGTFCFFASLYEISALTGGVGKMPPRLGILWEEHLKHFPEYDMGTVPVSESLETLTRFTREIGINVKRILVNPSFLSKIKVPPELADKIQPSSGPQRIPTPHLRIIAQQDSTGLWHTHAETDSGQEKSQRRFEELYERGWVLTAMAIEFE